MEPGYSLIELLVVLVILALLAIGAGILVGDLGERRARTTPTDEVATLVAETTARARLEGRTITIEPTAGGPSLLIDGKNEPVSASVRVSAAIVMDAGGFSSGGQIDVADGEGRWTVLRIEPLTGAISRQVAQ